MRILIAEDRKDIAKALKVLLEHQRFSVDIVHNGTDALDYIFSTPYDGIVLDIMMPGMDGMEVLSRARQAGNTVPVLFLSAKAEVEDRVAGLNAGADDYLAKPFASAEFVARVKALTRRRDSFLHDVLTFGDLSLDCNSYILSSKNNDIRLNNKEFQMMELFMRHPRNVFSSEHLMDKIWGPDSQSEIDVVWTHIGFLRKKLKQLKTSVEIRTVRGAGYSLEVPIC